MNKTIIAALVLGAAAGQAQACGDFPHSVAALTFDGALEIDLSIVSFGGFHTCDPLDQVGNQQLVSAHVAIDAGNGQSFAQDYLYHTTPFQVPIAHLTQAVDYAPGSYTASVQGSVTFSFLESITHFDQSTGTFITQNFSRTADMFFTRAETPVTVSHAPEPATYAMLLAGFGLIGFMRKRQQ